MTTAEFVDGYAAYARAGGLAVNTVHTRRKVLGRLLADAGCSPLQVTATQLVGWLSHAGWSPNTRAAYVSHARAFFGWLVEFGHRCDDPTAKLRRPKVPRGLPRPVSNADLTGALAAADDWLRMAVTLAAFAGLRASDCAGLRREDITEATIRIRNGKGGRDALLPCHPRIWALVRDLPAGPIFANAAGKPVQPAHVSRRVAVWFDHHGLPDVTLHRFRHWYATRLLTERDMGGAGANLRVVQELMRHASVSTTAIYTQVTDAQKLRAVAALHVDE